MFDGWAEKWPPVAGLRPLDIRSFGMPSVSTTTASRRNSWGRICGSTWYPFWIPVLEGELTIGLIGMYRSSVLEQNMGWNDVRCRRCLRLRLIAGTSNLIAGQVPGSKCISSCTGVTESSSTQNSALRSAAVWNTWSTSRCERSKIMGPCQDLCTGGCKLNHLNLCIFFFRILINLGYFCFQAAFEVCVFSCGIEFGTQIKSTGLAQYFWESFPPGSPGGIEAGAGHVLWPAARKNYNILWSFCLIIILIYINHDIYIYIYKLISTKWVSFFGGIITYTF